MSPMYQMTAFVLIAGAYFVIFAVLQGAAPDRDTRGEE